MSTMDPNGAYPSDKHRLWLILFIITSLLFIGTLVFGVWAFGGRQDYKNNVNQKISKAVSDAEQQTHTTDVAQAAEDAKKPLKTFVGPSDYGSIKIQYPKTWSAYVSEGIGSSNNPIDGYFQPDFVPSTTDQTNAFALRVQVQQQSYDQVLQQYQGDAQRGIITVVPFTPANVPKVVGVRIDGQILQNKQGSMIILPLRANSLLIWTESSKYEADFNNNILPNFSFSP